jgi:hypothetical protein
MTHLQLVEVKGDMPSILIIKTKTRISPKKKARLRMNIRPLILSIHTSLRLEQVPLIILIYSERIIIRV